MCPHRGYVQVELKKYRDELTKQVTSENVIERLQVRTLPTGAVVN